MIADLLHFWPLTLALVIYWLGLLAMIISDEREPALTTTWLFVLVFVPVVGVFLFIFFGRDWRAVAQRKGWIERMVAIQRATMVPIYDRNCDAAKRFHEEWGGTPAQHVVRAIDSQEVSAVLPASSLELYVRGADMFARLKEDLRGATRFVHLQYFIWRKDVLTAEITAILKDRLEAGVEVRITYDFLGSFLTNKSELHALAAAGAQIRADITDLARINYRNHGKIAIIDGEIGYTGGMNMGQEYIDGGKRFDSWRDTHMRLTGQAVASLERLFAARWYESRKGRDNLFAARYMPTPDPDACNGKLVKVTAQSVEHPWSSTRRTHMVAIGQARRSVWIQSPYFVPDYSMYDALINAALAGVDVRFMMTGIPDKRLPFAAAQTYFRKLIEAGGSIYLYEAGFFHAKTVVVDECFGAVGTMNMDVRSLKLHKELMVWVFDESFAGEIAGSFRTDMEHCRLVTIEDVLAVGRLKHFCCQTARLFSNLL